MISPLLSARMNCLRWVAAFLVMISHLKPILFVEYANLQHKSVLTDAFYFVTGLGHEAVVVFFVMSGLLVGGLSLERHIDRRFVPSEFVIHRFSRIYIVLIPALMAGFVLDHIGLLHFNAAGIYTESLRFRMPGIVANQLSWHLVLENGLMLQQIVAPVLGSNGALWSISYEWWCYALFFFAFYFLVSCTRRPPKLHYALLVCLLLVLLPIDVMRYFLVWMIGVAVLFSPLRHIPCNRLLGYAGLIASVLWSRIDQNNAAPIMGFERTFIHDLVLACACFFLFTALNQYRPLLPRRPIVHQVLAGFSYTTYLVHLPFMTIIIAILNTHFGLPVLQQPSWSGMAFFVLIGVLVYLYSYAFSRFTERHTDALRSQLHSLLYLMPVKR